MVDQFASEPGVFTMAELVHVLRMFPAGFQMTDDARSGDRRAWLLRSRRLSFVVRGVEMFLGLEPEDAGDGGSCPLRRITHLCGLTLGGDHATDQGPVRHGGFRQERQHVQGVFLAAVDGHLLDVLDQPIGRISGAEDFNDQREAGR